MIPDARTRRAGGGSAGGGGSITQCHCREAGQPRYDPTTLTPHKGISIKGRALQPKNLTWPLPEARE